MRRHGSRYVMVVAACITYGVIMAAYVHGPSPAVYGGAVAPHVHELSLAARNLLKQHAKSIAWVDGAVRTTVLMKGVNVPPQEQKFEALGTIIDVSGLTVTSSSCVGVDSLLRRVAMYSPDGERVQPEIKSEFSGIRLRLADGTEVPARIVLRDVELDVVLLMPDAESEVGSKLVGEYPALNAECATRAEVLDEVVLLGRLGEHLNRQAAVYLSRICAVVERPYLVYVASAEIVGGQLGIPVFTSEGHVLGIQLARRNRVPANMVSSMTSASNLSPVIIPMGEIVSIATQAIRARGEVENTKKE